MSIPKKTNGFQINCLLQSVLPFPFDLQFARISIPVPL